MLEILSPNDAFLSFLQLVAVVLLLLRGIWWVEDRIGERKAHEQDLVDRVPVSPEEQADVEHWLREGRG